MTQDDLRGDKTTWVNNNYTVVWYCNLQAYYVYHSSRGLIDKKYKFSDLKIYL